MYQTISQLIDRLTRAKQEHGDIPVYVVYGRPQVASFETFQAVPTDECILLVKNIPQGKVLLVVEEDVTLHDR